MAFGAEFMDARREGYAEGYVKGFAETFAKRFAAAGHEEDYAERFAIGYEIGKIEVVKEFFSDGMPLCRIAKATGYTEEQILEIVNSPEKNFDKKPDSEN